MQKRLKVEGKPEAMLVQLMRDYGRNRDISIETATVTSPPPTIKIKLADGIELNRDDVTLTQQADDRGLSAGDSVIVIYLVDKMHGYVLDKAVR